MNNGIKIKKYKIFYNELKYKQNLIIYWILLSLESNIDHNFD